MKSNITTAVDALVMSTATNEQAGIIDGYQDLMDGKNIRGVVVHRHADVS
jgi:hypothetical protein